MNVEKLAATLVLLAASVGANCTVGAGCAASTGGAVLLQRANVASKDIASEEAGETRAFATPQPTWMPGLKNNGRGCWRQCGHKGGVCAHCGSGACCRPGWRRDPAECKTAVFAKRWGGHRCVSVQVPTPSPTASPTATPTAAPTPTPTVDQKTLDEAEAALKEIAEAANSAEEDVAKVGEDDTKAASVKDPTDLTALEKRVAQDCRKAHKSLEYVMVVEEKARNKVRKCSTTWKDWKRRKECKAGNAKYYCDKEHPLMTQEDARNFRAKHRREHAEKMIAATCGKYISAPPPAPPITTAVNPVLVKADHECIAEEISVGTYDTLEECARQVRARHGRFFIYGKPDPNIPEHYYQQTGRCAIEMTQSASCEGGFEKPTCGKGRTCNAYDFYDLRPSANEDEESARVAARCEGPSKCGTNNFCVGFEGLQVYCYGNDHGCLWKSNDCAEDSDCSKYTANSAKFLYSDYEAKYYSVARIGDMLYCPDVEGWAADACTCGAVIPEPSSAAAASTHQGWASPHQEICPAQLFTDNNLCDDGTAVPAGVCCPDGGCPSGCVSGRKAWGKCNCKGCPKERKLDLSDEAAFVKVHNYFRCLHGQPAVSWDEGAASNAAAAATQCCQGGGLTHSKSYEATPAAAENLAKGQGSPEFATRDWYNEVVTPGYKPGTWGTEALGAGHYTALIWKATTKIGCAACGEKSDKVWACHYAHEPGNFGKLPAYEANVPQNNSLLGTRQTCCAQVYGT